MIIIDVDIAPQYNYRFIYLFIYLDTNMAENFTDG